MLFNRGGRQVGEYKHIYIEEGSLLGKGQCGAVYSMGDNKVVKLFYNTISKESILTEYEKSKAAFDLGIDSEKCYGLVLYNDRIGIEFERINGISVENYVIKHNDEAKNCAQLMAIQLKKINSAIPDTNIFPSIKKFYLECIDKCRDDNWISVAESEKLVEFVEAIPECNTLIYGDYHFQNVLIENGRARIIDLADCMKGHPIFDLLVSNIYFHFLPIEHKEIYSMITNLDPEVAEYMWEEFIRVYFEISDDVSLNRIYEIIDVYSMLKIMLAPYSFSNLPKESLKQFVEMGRSNLMPRIDSYIGIIPEGIEVL